MKIRLLIYPFGLLFVLGACQAENRVEHLEPVGAAVLGVDSDTLLPSLFFQPSETQGEDEVSVAWQAGYPLTSFDPQQRPQLDLGGSWRKERVRLDSALTMAGRGPEGLGALEAEAKGRFQVDYNDSDWKEHTLPGVENFMTSTGPESYEGGVWYRRSFPIPAEWEGLRVTFNALAINYVADVWINGQWVGYHEGGYTPFALDLAPVLNYGGENTIAIRVDNPPWGSRNDLVPGVEPDWWNYTGVIQELYLEAAPALWIVRADVRTPDTSGDVLVDVVLHNAGSRTQRGELSLQVYTTDSQSPTWRTNPLPGAIISEKVGDPLVLDVRVAAGQALALPANLLAIPEPQTWSPENPALYVLEANLSTGEDADIFMTQFGVRTLAVEDHQWLLNGDPYFMAGIARHEEWPDSGRTATWDKIRFDLEFIQEHNANFVRTAHYPNHPYTYILTDRLGLLAAEEIPVWQYGPADFDAQARRKIADQMWREMILAGSNRPSIILWSMHNESQDVPERAAYIDRLVRDYQANLQDGRLLMQSAAADRGGPADATQAGLDLAGWTLYFGVFYGEDFGDDSAEFLRQASAAYPDKPILVTEYGIWSRGAGGSIYRQVDLVEDILPAFVEVTTWDENGQINPEGFVGGITWWAMFDWYTAHTYLQTMGLYGMDRETAKPVAELVQESYRIWQNSP